MEEGFFVNVSEPDSLRISVLAASKLSLESLKIHLKLQELNKQKLETKTSLDKQFAELVNTLHELTDLLPHQEILEQVKKSHHSTKSKKVLVDKAPVSKKKKSDSELDKLNDALEEIEKRLSTLQ